MRRFQVIESVRPAWHRPLQATVRTLLPVAGPLLAEHLDNLAALRVALPPLEAIAAHERVLLLSPHPDDETLGTGGLIKRLVAQGNTTRLLFLTNGDGSRTTQLVLNARNPFRADKNLFQIACNRQLEALAAAQKLGLNAQAVSFLSFPDGCMPDVLRTGVNADPVRSPTTGKTRVEYERASAPNAPYTRAGLIEALGNEIREFAPTLVLTTHPNDTHPDHVAAYDALVAALQSVAAQLPALPRLLVFPIHYGIWPVPNGFHPQLPLAPPARLLTSGRWFSLELTAQELASKQAALKCYASQLASTPRYLHAFVRRNEIFTFYDLPTH